MTGVCPGSWTHRRFIWTTSGRLRGIQFACSTDALKTLQHHRRGESDLIDETASSI